MEKKLGQAHSIGFKLFISSNKSKIFKGIFMALTKNDLVEMIYENLGIPQTEAHKLVESTIDIIKDELAGGKNVKISGFGNWTVREKNARQVRNPQTGEAITIDARKVVTFKCFNKLRDACQ
jgi:integration host factor subunit alpha